MDYEDLENSLSWRTTPVLPERPWDAMTTYATSLSYRLPTRAELLTLLVSTNTPKILDSFSLDGLGHWSCWTSDEVTDPDIINRQTHLQSRAYIVSFDSGISRDLSKLSYNTALLVADTYYLLESAGLIMTSVDGSQFVVTH